MKIEYNKRNLTYEIPLFLMALYAFTTGLSKYIYLGGAKTICLSFVVGIVVLLHKKVYSTKTNIANILAALMFLVMAFNRNHNLERGIYVTAFFWLTLIIFFWISQKSNCWYKYIIRLLQGIGLFYSFFTILFLFTPTLYKSRIVTLFDESYAYALLQTYNQGYMPGLTQHYSTNAIYLVIGLISCSAILLCSNIEKKGTKKQWIIYMMLFVALFLTAKRAHILFYIAAMLICYYFLNSDKPLSRWKKMIGSIILGITVVGIVSMFLPSVLNVVYRFVETAGEGDITQGRGVRAGMALQIFMRNKWFGIGWCGFQYWHQKVTGTFINVHCVYLQLLCECGIIGSLPFFVFFILQMRNAIGAVKRIAKRNRKVENSVLMSASFSLIIQVFFLLYCITGNPLYDPSTFFTYICACAMGQYCYNHLEEV